MRIPRTVLATTAIGAVLAGGGVALATASSAGASTVTDAVSAVTTVDTATTPAAKAKGVRTWWKNLTDEQRTCLKDANLTRPVGPLTIDQRRALRAEVDAAAQKCNIQLPKQGPVAAFWNGLTPSQIACVQGTGLTRPLGRMTPDARRALAEKLVAAAKECGVNPPALPTPKPSSSSATPGSTAQSSFQTT